MMLSDFNNKDTLIISMMQVLFNGNNTKIKLFIELVNTLGISLNLDTKLNGSICNFIKQIQNMNISQFEHLTSMDDKSIMSIDNNKVKSIVKREENSLVKIGEGGFGSVYKYYNYIDDKYYALKKINVEDNENLQKMVNETRIMANLKHKNIVDYSYSWIENSTHLNIQMELCLTDLHFYISNRKNFDCIESLWISNDILDGIEYLHSNNIIHGDISSKNIFISSDYNIKIGDFGLSTITDEEIISVSSSGSYFYGNPIYGSPELLNNNQYCKQSDIYSFGILLFELMSQLTTLHQRNIFIRKLKQYSITLDDINKISILPSFENSKYYNILKLLTHKNYIKRPLSSQVRLLLSKL